MKKKNRKIDTKTTKQVVIDVGLHKLLKIESANSGQSIRELVESALAEVYDFVLLNKNETD